MASRKDMQDIMGLPAEGVPKPAAQKRQRPAAPSGKKLTGINREVLALMGERPPPVAIYDEKKAYKSRRHTGPAKKWLQTPFMNPARRDDLVLKHWRRKQPPAGLPNDPDTAMEDTETQEHLPVKTAYEFDKYNISVEVPAYTDEQYATHLQSSDWSREETDYLFDLVKEYHYRWAAIWDRYDFRPATPHLEDIDSSSAVALPRKERSMEDMKDRFYKVQAALMTLQTPTSQMTQAEFTLHETLTKYNPLHEKDRKMLAAKLLGRSREDVMEEQFLLVELQRICASNDRLEAERNEIRSVLDLERPTAPITQYQTQQGLNILFNQIFAQDKSRKKLNGSNPPRLSITTDLQTPTGITPPHHRDSLVSASGTSTKKGGMSAGLPQQPVRVLSPAAERRFGVSTHNDQRLQSGVTFRSDKLLKIRQAKSVVQTQKIVAALIELGVPDVVAMPSLKTCEAYEKLVQRVHKLLESRKGREKEEVEMKQGRALVKELQKRLSGLGVKVEGYVEEESVVEDTVITNAEPEEEDDDDDTKMEDDADANGDDDAEGSADENGDGDGDEDNDNDNDDSQMVRQREDDDSSVNADDLSSPSLGSEQGDGDAEVENGAEEDDDAGENEDDDDDVDELAQDDEEDEDMDADGETETNGITRPSSMGADGEGDEDEEMVDADDK